MIGTIAIIILLVLCLIGMLACHWELEDLKRRVDRLEEWKELELLKGS